mmetsp:Transcript_42873/g.91147  ORF Transcript_42873/g.91147 Transcript_42873/m.91147 type:complete len:223 (-) Transcript_42873:252-920(-)
MGGLSSSASLKSDCSSSSESSAFFSAAGDVAVSWAAADSARAAGEMYLLPTLCFLFSRNTASPFWFFCSLPGGVTVDVCRFSLLPSASSRGSSEAGFGSLPVSDGNSVLCTFFFGAATFLINRDSSLMTGFGKVLPAALMDSTPRFVIFLRTGSMFACWLKSFFFWMGLLSGEGRVVWQDCWIAFVTVLSCLFAGQMEDRRPSLDSCGADFDWNLHWLFSLL